MSFYYWNNLSEEEKGAVEVIGESDKDNETRVIKNLKKNSE
jgi:hypothetical protein